MSTAAHFALRGAAGLFVVTAVLLTIWAARDSGARIGPAPAAHEAGSESRSLHSTRIHRAPVARTFISTRRQQALEAQPITKVAEE